MSIWAQQLYQLRDIPENRNLILENESFEFFGFCLYHLKQHHAQCFQDCWVIYEERLDFDLSRSFAEFGATDGKTISNTFLLEQMGWHGVVCEPNPIYHEDLTYNRKNVIKKAVTSRSGETIDFHCNSASDLSSTIFDRNVVDSKEIIKVETISLNDLLRDHFESNEIGYISMDTEGSEVEILESFDFDKYDVSLWSIEHNFDQDKIRRIMEIMEPRGYEIRFPDFSRWDLWLRKKRS